MIFILHSGIDESAIGSKLGKPEYSYFFVLDGFRKALEHLGTVRVVEDPMTEVDAIAESEAEDCLFMSFTPPHHSPVGLKCPTVSVFAWEFSNLPYETWDEDPRNDWRYVLRDHGRSITLSSYSSNAVTEAMGKRFPVATIPVPVWDQFEGVREILSDPEPLKTSTLHFDGNLLDSRNFSLEVSKDKATQSKAPTWNNEDFVINADYASPDITRLSGFYAPEQWGAWSRATTPFIELPYALSGVISVVIEGHAYHSNIGRDITVTLGSSKAVLRLNQDTGKHMLEFVLMEPTSRLSFRGLETTPPAGSTDRRTLGIGLVSLSFSRLDTPDEPEPASLEQSTNDTPGNADEATDPQHPDLATNQKTLNLSGVVYTSVFNPGDGRKNWIDMVTAFCYAHKTNENATLVLKMATNEANSYMGTLRLLMTQLAPFDCRIVAIRGFLPGPEFDKLMAATSYYVNCSHCEGLCLPVMEFLSGGIPAIAPDHTAMADYISDDLAFKVKSSVEQNVWPDDPRDLFRTLRYRINWESLRDGFIDSYRVATEDPVRYKKMSIRARKKMQDYASIRSVSKKLARFLKV